MVMQRCFRYNTIAMRGLRYFGRGATVFVLAIVFAVTITPLARAQTGEGFSLQVSPSPLVASVEPDTETTLELQIRNTNTTAQDLKMGLRSFTVDSTSGQVKLGDTVPADVQSLVHFQDPTFTLEAGEIFTQRVHVYADKNKGFSYNFAITISQQNPPKSTNGQSAIAGSVAVFTLISVDKPGAVRKFELTSVSVSKHSYEYLPAEISVKLKNTGNVNVQPTGTVFIQRHSSDTKPLATLALNDTGGYILPGTSRTFTVSWSDGFPHYETTQVGNKTIRKLVWQGNSLSKLRFGKYVAKVVAIYDDGQHDVPAMAEVSFWVIPWRLLLAALAAAIILLVGVIATVRSFGRVVRRTSRKLSHNKPKPTNEK